MAIELSTKTLQLHDFLETKTAIEVYFQPPSNLKMTYPCLVVQLDTDDVQYADNIPFRSARKYQVTLIDHHPESPTLDVLRSIPYCKHERRFVTSNLTHDVFNLYH